MKKTIGLLIAAVFMIMQSGAAFAAVRSFTLTADIPTATGVAISAFSVSAPGAIFTGLPSNATTLSFDTMTYNTTYGFWAPDHSFAIDIGSTGGSGNVTTVVTYVEGSNPNSTTTGHGLGYKATATFVKTSLSIGGSTTDTLIAAHGTKRLIDLTGTTVTPAQVLGGWLRVYLGIVTNPSLVAGSETFSNQDRPGTYDGILTFTATIS